MLIVVQLADQESALHAYLESKRWPLSFKVFCYRLLLALMVMAKRNYYLFLLSSHSSAADCADPAGWPIRLRVIRKWAVVLLLAAALYFPVRIAHEAINGFDISRLQSSRRRNMRASL